MSAEIIGILGCVFMLILLGVGMPVGFAMALAGFIGTGIVIGFLPSTLYLAQTPYTFVSNYDLSVLPLFMLMGNFAYFSGLTDDAYRVARNWVGGFRGGLAMATVGGAAIFSAICGSSVATAGTMAAIAYPEMKRAGYDPGLSTGSIAAGGSLGNLIPPGTIFVVYAVFAEESVGKLFIASIFPGILLASLYMLTIYILCRIRPSMGPPVPSVGWRERFISLKDTLAILLLAVLVLGGIWLGIFTANEAAGIGAFGTLMVALIKRKATIKNLKEALIDTIIISAMIFIILIGSMIFNYFVTVSRLSEYLGGFVVAFSLPAVGVLVIILIVYLILGTAMDTFAMTVLTLPIFLPILRNLGVDLIWFGVLFVVMCEMSMISPPVGMTVFVIGGIAKDVSVYQIFKGVTPFVIAMLVCTVLLVAFPQISLFLTTIMK